MPGFSKEISGKRERGNDYERRTYLVTEATDPATAITSALSLAPTAIGIWYRSAAVASETKRQDVYEITVTWSPRSPTSGSAPRRTKTEFDFGSETQRIKYAYATTAYKRTTSPALPDVDLNEAINWKKGEGVEGVDIPSPTFSVRITNQYAASEVGANYFAALAAARCTVNSDPFWGWEAGEVLFLGATGSHDEGEQYPWTITFSFAFNDNVTDADLPGITGVAKKGWEYLETVSADGLNTDVIEPALNYAYVHQVHKETAFSSLNVGDSPFGDFTT
jgi:hypothetical protein